MHDRPKIEFAALDAVCSDATVVLAGDGASLGATASKLDDASGGALTRAMRAADFKGKSKSSLELLGTVKIDPTRVIIAGIGKAVDAAEKDWLTAGGFILAQITRRRTKEASIIVETEGLEPSEQAAAAAAIAAGALLRSYTFRRHKTKKSDANSDQSNGNENQEELQRIKIHTSDPAAAEAQFERQSALVEGTCFARDLVNEPANILGPVEFADRCAALNIEGLEVEVLDADALADLGMGALLGVAQGSEKPARVVVMQWHGAKSKRSKPVCFAGKGVCFDTGGISIKPAGGMEEMKGDMAGGATVAGLMIALAARKAAVNAVGLIGLVENMPSHNAQRPGDIVTSMSGQTVEVLNTDAEGRLVLADVMWYAQQRFKPRFVIDLATLTGAIIVALGKEHAGLFANDDKLASELLEAGQTTGERVWRMPLDKAYDKLLDSPTADMKNIGGRTAGSITAAQFLARFIEDTPWAHLDVAGVAMASTKTETSQGWASGWGVRLLDTLITKNYERS